MTTYRMYSLDARGRIGLSADIDANSVEEAIRFAAEVKPNLTRGEIWQGRRLVAMVNGREWELDPA